tara:strand:- start:763 stop:1263 length:501 start_codon:yes stop_codon:yes gene_type:complete
MSRQAQIQAVIDQFVSEITELITESAIETVQNALMGAVSAPAPRKASKPGRKKFTKAAGPARKKKSGKRVRRTAEDLEATANDVLAFIDANANCGMSDISKALRQDPIKLRPALQLLTAAGRVKVTGKKRGTKYHAGGAGTAKKTAAPKTAKNSRTKKKTARKAKR